MNVHPVWHEHIFSPYADIEADDGQGRFDAMEDDTGALFVLDVGLGRILTRCETRGEALKVARAAADVWRPEGWCKRPDGRQAPRDGGKPRSVWSMLTWEGKVLALIYAFFSVMIGGAALAVGGFMLYVIVSYCITGS